METLGARQVLQALVQGFDPVSGVELPSGTVVQRPEVVQALLSGITALESDALRSRRRSQVPENVGRAWSQQEEQQLAAAFRGGEPLGAIAARHRRTVAGIEARLERIGLLAADKRITRNRYITRDSPPPAAAADAAPSSESP